MEIRSILVPIDFSPSAAAAFQRAIELAKVFGAELELLHAYQLPVQLGVGEPVPLPQEFFDQLRKRAQAQLDEWVEKARAQGLKASGTLRQDAPAHAIPEAAGEKHVDLVVMGTRGLTGLKHFALGSVADRVVRSAPCPVLTVGHHD